VGARGQCKGPHAGGGMTAARGVTGRASVTVTRTSVDRTIEKPGRRSGPPYLFPYASRKRSRPPRFMEAWAACDRVLHRRTRYAAYHAAVKGSAKLRAFPGGAILPHPKQSGGRVGTSGEVSPSGPPCQNRSFRLPTMPPTSRFRALARHAEALHPPWGPPISRHTCRSPAQVVL
jgi:hypothetical protein